MRNSECGGARLSRRAVLGGSAISMGVLATDGGLPPSARADAAASPVEADNMSIPIVLRVNGVDRALSVASGATLVEVLRGPLGLAGTKIACHRGACSACTVLMDGLPICSCMMLAAEVGDREIRTIEGLANDDHLHPVQTAFIAHDAMQCGFCTSGMALSCAALLERNPDPTREDIERAISGHICRCGTYPHVIEAALSAARARRG